MMFVIDMLWFVLQHPLSWQISADGTRMIGHMILKKTVREGVGPTSSAAILGLKVVGGKLLENGGRGALIEKVKKGSTADVEGHLRPGDCYCAYSAGNETNITQYLKHGDRVSTVVKVLCYKSEGCWFDPSWCQWIFH